MAPCDLFPPAPHAPWRSPRRSCPRIPALPAVCLALLLALPGCQPASQSMDGPGPAARSHPSLPPGRGPLSDPLSGDGTEFINGEIISVDGGEFITGS